MVREGTGWVWFHAVPKLVAAGNDESNDLKWMIHLFHDCSSTDLAGKRMLTLRPLVFVLIFCHGCTTSTVKTLLFGAFTWMKDTCSRSNEAFIIEKIVIALKKYKWFIIYCWFIISCTYIAGIYQTFFHGCWIKLLDCQNFKRRQISSYQQMSTLITVQWDSAGISFRLDLHSGLIQQCVESQCGESNLRTGLGREKMRKGETSLEDMNKEVKYDQITTCYRREFITYNFSFADSFFLPFSHPSRESCSELTTLTGSFFTLSWILRRYDRTLTYNDYCTSG